VGCERPVWIVQAPFGGGERLTVTGQLQTSVANVQFASKQPFRLASLSKKRRECRIDDAVVELHRPRSASTRRSGTIDGAADDSAPWTKIADQPYR